MSITKIVQFGRATRGSVTISFDDRKVGEAYAIDRSVIRYCQMGGIVSPDWGTLRVVVSVSVICNATFVRSRVELLQSLSNDVNDNATTTFS